MLGTHHAATPAFRIPHRVAAGFQRSREEVSAGYDTLPEIDVYGLRIQEFSLAPRERGEGGGEGCFLLLQRSSFFSPSVQGELRAAIAQWSKSDDKSRRIQIDRCRCFHFGYECSLNSYTLNETDCKRDCLGPILIVVALSTTNWFYLSD